MQVSTLLVAFFATYALAAPVDDTAGETADGSDIDMTNFKLTCSGTKFVSCVAALHDHAKSCNKAVKDKGKNISEDKKCAGGLYKLYQKDPEHACTGCFSK